jgi:hypothetical protein
MLQDAAAKAARAPVVYHPSNLGFKFPRQFRELAAIGNQWRFFDDGMHFFGTGLHRCLVMYVARACCPRMCAFESCY